MEEAINRLCKIYHLTISEAELLISKMKPIEFQKGDFLVREGQLSTQLYIIKAGVLRAFRNNDGEEAALWFASAGEVIIQVWGYCRNQPSEANIECEPTCEM